MKKYIVLVSSIAGLISCATVSETFAPDGRKAYALNCSGQAVGWDKCYSAAGEICGSKGYDILAINNEPTAVGASTGSGFVNQSGGSAGFSSFFAMGSQKTMLISCKAPK
jgi:hypothetical protein